MICLTRTGCMSALALSLFCWPARAAIDVTTISVTAELPEDAVSIKEVTVDGKSVAVTNRKFTAELTVPTDANSLSFVLGWDQDGETHTRTLEVTLEDLGPPIPGLDVSASELRSFVGGGGILVWVDAGGQMQMVDFRDNDPQVRAISTDIACVNPIVSPDGTRVVYSQGSANGPKLLYVRSLSGGSAQSIATGDVGYWQVDGTGEYIVYADWSDKAENGSSGSTYRQKLVAGTTDLDGSATTVHDRAMDSGPNADGNWLGQIYDLMYAYDVGGDVEYSYNDFFLLDGTVADHQTCNGSMAPSTSAQMMVLVIPHDWVRIFSFQSNRFVETSRFELPAGMREWEFPEWSTDPGYFTAVLRSGGFNLRLYVAKVATGEMVPEYLAVTPWSTSVSYNHLWVEP